MLSNEVGDFSESLQDLTSRRCVSITFDAKFCVLVEAGGEDGLRFRQCDPDAGKMINVATPGQTNLPATASHAIVSEVVRYLNLPTSHVAFTPYNMMLCCHRNRMSMVRHCTGRLVYQTMLDCGVDISGVAFDNASDSFFVSDAGNNCVLCMRYMEFHKSRKLDTKFSIVPSGLCIFANTIVIPNSSTAETYCGLCYKLDDASVYKINRVQLTRRAPTGKEQKNTEALLKQPQLTSLNGVVVLPQSGSQQEMATMIGISDTDQALYTYKVRLRKVKEGVSQVSFKSRDDSLFVEQEGNVRLPRSLAAISNEYVAVYYEVNRVDNRVETCGILVFRVKP